MPRPSREDRWSLGNGAAAMCRRDMPRTRNSNDVKAARVLHDVIRMDK